MILFAWAFAGKCGHEPNPVAMWWLMRIATVIYAALAIWLTYQTVRYIRRKLG